MKKFVNPWESQNPWQQGGEYHNLALDVPTVGDNAGTANPQNQIYYTPRGEIVYKGKAPDHLLNVYVVGNKIGNNFEYKINLNITNELFKLFCSLVWNEATAGGADYREAFAFANMVVNYLDQGGSHDLKMIEDIVAYDNTFSQAVSPEKIREYKQNRYSNNFATNRRNNRYEVEAVINALAGYVVRLKHELYNFNNLNQQAINHIFGSRRLVLPEDSVLNNHWRDYSNGANRWDGADLIAPTNSVNSHRQYRWYDPNGILNSYIELLRTRGYVIEFTSFVYVNLKKDALAMPVCCYGDTLFYEVLTGFGEGKDNNVRIRWSEV